ncbi:hypothetical protein MAPG_01486 [Magnaporthiopsis poae ATCC 64411]|uniref:Uncharacterized protein n=1 Tax=Magnaporthiopsis poae (strain ATCC 64411 / 73-15) TaxID=644358 RepID=A0A0C4DNU0_MAGP6|nr:hypothetical protein MAPG_01486 [Magnaporthiopsis poae ATCC 64411]
MYHTCVTSQGLVIPDRALFGASLGSLHHFPCPNKLDISLSGHCDFCKVIIGQSSELVGSGMGKPRHSEQKVITIAFPNPENVRKSRDNLLCPFSQKALRVARLEARAPMDIAVHCFDKIKRHPTLYEDFRAKRVQLVKNGYLHCWADEAEGCKKAVMICQLSDSPWRFTKSCAGLQGRAIDAAIPYQPCQLASARPSPGSRIFAYKAEKKEARQREWRLRDSVWNSTCSRWQCHCLVSPGQDSRLQRFGNCIGRI